MINQHKLPIIKKQLEALDLPHSGQKPELVTRLLHYHQQHPEIPLQLKQFQDELRNNKLHTTEPAHD